MLALSRKARYALRALYALAGASGEHVLIVELAERERIPRKFLESILVELRNAGILRSKKGKGGGYALVKPADRITIGEVLRVVDGSLAPIPCVSARAYVRCEECPDETTCATRMVMKQVHDAVTAILDHTTVAAVRDRAARRRSGGAGLTTTP